MAAAWLRAPTFLDPEKTRSAAFVHWILLSTAAVAALGLLAGPFIYASTGSVLLYALLLLGLLPGLAALRRGHVRRVSQLYLTSVWLLIMGAVAYHGGPRAPAAMALPVLIVMAGFLHGPRAAITLGLLSSAMILAAMASRAPAELPGEFAPLRYWLVLTISISMSAALVVLAMRSIDGALSETRASERRNAEMVEASPDGMVLVSADGVVESANRVALRIGRLPAEKVLGRKFLDLGVVPPDRIGWVVENMPRAFSGELEGPVEIDLIHVGGSCTPVEMRVRRVVRADESVGVQVTLRDLTERREAAKEVEALEARLVQSQKLEGIARLAGGVAHDFNNHLTAIRINSELLLKHVEGDREAREVLTGIETATERSGDLIRQLLAFSRKQILQPRVIDLNELVAGLDPLLRRILPEDVVLQTFCTGGLGRVRADPAQIETALLNLIVNGRDAMPDGGTITVETGNVTVGPEAARRIHGLEPGAFVTIAVDDSGIGMDEAKRSRAFDPFFSTKDERGSGLGLSAVYGIVRQSGGTMTVESEPDRGSRFRIYLPRVEESLDAHQEAEAEAEPLPERADGTILLVEDDEMVRALAVSVLRSRGYEVLSANDGLQALELVKDEDPSLDLVVSDVVMPGLGGLGLARALHDSRPDLPVLFISGYTERPGDGFLDPGVELLQKPFTASQLARRVHALLARVKPC